MLRARGGELLLKPDPRGSIIRVPSRAGVLPASDPRALRSSGSGVRHGVHALEQMREAHEEVERLERFIASDFKTDAITRKERLLQNHRVNRALDEMVSKTKRLRAAYEDADGARAEEIAALGGAGEEAYGAFYDRLKETREYHRAYPGFHAPTSEDFLAPFKSDRAPEFSGEEHGGRYLDLHAAHHAFQNAPFGRKTDYVAYLADVRDFASVPRDKKFGAAYADYLDALADYLRSFHRRVRPLVFLEKITAKAEQEFERQWNEGAVPGWEDKGVRTAGGDAEANRVDLEAFATVDEMAASLSPDDVRAALGAMGLKQGGTEEQRRDRLWSTRGKSLAEMDKKLFAKGAATAGDSESAARLEAKAKAVARREAGGGAPRAARGDWTPPRDRWRRKRRLVSRSSRRRRWRMMILSRRRRRRRRRRCTTRSSFLKRTANPSRTAGQAARSQPGVHVKSRNTRTGGVARTRGTSRRRGTSSACAPWSTPRRSRRCVLTCLPASFSCFSLFLAPGMMDIRTGHGYSMTHNA